MQTDYQQRRRLLVASFPALHMDAFLVTSLPNVRYLSGFTGSNGALLLTKDAAYLFTDPRYQTQAPQESDCAVRIAKGQLLKAVATLVKQRRLKAVGFEQTRISLGDFEQVQELLKSVRLEPIGPEIEEIRRVKSADEIGTIRTSVQLNSAALEAALRQFKGGMTEVDLAAEIEYRMRRLGADGTAFETIVASGARTALPHAHPSDLAIGVNQLLLIDMGARVAGYCSDMTRSYAVGKVSPKAKRMYRAVLESQLAALDAVKPGVTCAAVDGAARGVLSGYGLEQAFIHSTGHGLGLEIHEGPRVGRKDRTRLEAGMVITIEPGVYIEGVGGVRIEDTVLVTESGCEILTPTSKELTVL